MPRQAFLIYSVPNNHFLDILYDVNNFLPYTAITFKADKVPTRFFSETSMY